MRTRSEHEPVVLSWSFQLIEPPGCEPNRPAIVALSLKVAPTMPAGGVCVVSIDGEAWPITDRKSGVSGGGGGLGGWPGVRGSQEVGPGWVGLEAGGVGVWAV